MTTLDEFKELTEGIVEARDELNGTIIRKRKIRTEFASLSDEDQLRVKLWLDQQVKMHVVGMRVQEARAWMLVQDTVRSS